MSRLARHIPAIAEILGEKPATLYARMRELVREGLLDPAPGAGRGPPGVQATPETIAMLVVGMLASVSLTGSGKLARRVAEAAGGPGFAYTFAEELTRILSDEAKAAKVGLISVNTDVGRAVIHGYEKQDDAVFIGGRSPERPLAITIHLTNSAIRELAKAVKELS